MLKLLDHNHWLHVSKLKENTAFISSCFSFNLIYFITDFRWFIELELLIVVFKWLRLYEDLFITSLFQFFFWSLSSLILLKELICWCEYWFLMFGFLILHIFCFLWRNFIFLVFLFFAFFKIGLRDRLLYLL